MKKVKSVMDSQKKFVAYYRVSTVKQGQSGLGLDGQKAAVKAFVGDAPLLAEYTEVETGKNNNRVELQKAIAAAKKAGAILVIAKLDRLSRNAFFVMMLQNEKIPFVCCDNPHANELTIGILAVIAQDEAKRISERTKAALTAKVERLKAANLPENWRTSDKQTWTDEARQKAKSALKIKKESNENTQRAKDVAKMLRDKKMTYIEIATYLNDRKFQTANGCQFHKTSVMRLLEAA
jgi:DNA invertase Pin-like site-specific DNA recombinase